MNQFEWNQCVEKLQAEWPQHKAKFATSRWQNRFGHLDKRAFLAAIDAYADDNLTAPTVNSLAAVLPKGSHVHRPRVDHQHTWETVVDILVCQHCGKHAPGCGCQRCVCSHAGARPDGRHASGAQWMHCDSCNASWLDESVTYDEPPQPTARPTADDMAWKNFHMQQLEHISGHLSGTATLPSFYQERLDREADREATSQEDDDDYPF